MSLKKLVINRRLGEGFSIFDEDDAYIARIVILRAGRGYARVGIDAEPRYRVQRDELLTRPGLTGAGSSADSQGPVRDLTVVPAPAAWHGHDNAASSTGR